MAMQIWNGDTGGYPHPQFGLRSSQSSLWMNYKGRLAEQQKVFRFMLLVVLLLSLGGMSVIAQSSDPIVVTDAYGEKVTITDASRIITIDGSVTEIVFALGAAEQVVARDDSSLYPSQVSGLPSVGYVRRLSAEPVLALNPSLIITTESVGPVEAVEQLKASGVTFLVVPAANTIEGIITNIQTIATALGRETESEAVIARIEADYAAAQELIASVETHPRVMFIYARGAGAVSVAGTNTSADAMIKLAGGENAVTEFEGYQPITAEAVVTAAPDVILMMTGGLTSLGGIDGVAEQPGIAQTPAGENRRIVAMEDLYLLGFSTRTGTAILDLTYLLHDELEPPLLTLLRADGRFNTLLRGIEVGGQTALLSGAGEFTLFAPTDEAIAAVFPPDVLAGFFSSTISVQATFSYHLLDGIYATADLTILDGKTVPTLYSEGVLNVTTDDKGVVLNGSVHILEADIFAANGVIHIIDGVLLPQRP
jgi:iron complex transport system substrate-binding protein